MRRARDEWRANPRVPEVDTLVNPAGVKDLGELGNAGTAAAIYQRSFSRDRQARLRVAGTHRRYSRLER